MDIIDKKPEKIDNRDCFDIDNHINSECTDSINITLAPVLRNEIETSIEDDCDFNESDKKEIDYSYFHSNYSHVKPVKIYKEAMENDESSLKNVQEAIFNSSSPNTIKIPRVNGDTTGPSLKSASTSTTNKETVHIIKNQPLIMSAKPLLSEITQTTAKVSIGNTTISVPLLKPVCNSKYVHDSADLNKNLLKSKSSVQQSRKLFSQINSKNSTTLSVNRGQKLNPPTIVSLSQLQIKPSNNAKIVQATVVSNKLHLHSSMDVAPQSALITTPIRAKPNCAQKFLYPKQVSMCNNSVNHNQQAEEEPSSHRNKLVCTEFNTPTQDSVSSSVINESHFKNSESLIISNSRYLDSITLAIKQKMQKNLRYESSNETVSLEKLVGSETLPIIPPLEMDNGKSHKKSTAFRDEDSQITNSAPGVTNNITAIYATSSSPLSERITAASNSCSLSKTSITPFLNIPRTLSLMLSKNTTSQTTPSVIPMIIGNQGAISRTIADQVAQNNQFPKVITLKKTENENSQGHKPSPIHVIPMGTSSDHINTNQCSELLDPQSGHRNLGIILKKKRYYDTTENITKDSENLHLFDHNTILKHTNIGDYSVMSKTEQSHDKIFERTQNSTISSVLSEDINTVSAGNYLIGNNIKDIKLNSHKVNDVESSSKIEDSQNILLKQLLKNSSLNNNLNMSTMTAAPTSVCSQVISSRKVINVRAPSLGLVSSLEAQLARPVIPPVPASTAITTPNCVVAEPIKQKIELSSKVLDCKIKQPFKIISKETSFVSNPKFCSSIYTNRTDLDEVAYVHHPSIINVNQTVMTLDKFPLVRPSPSEEFVSSLKGQSITKNPKSSFVNLTERNITSDEKILFQQSELNAGSESKTLNTNKQNRFNTSLRNSTNDKNSLQVNLNRNKSPDAPPSSTKQKFGNRKNILSGEEKKDSGISNIINSSTFNEKKGHQLGQTMKLSSSNSLLENNCNAHIYSHDIISFTTDSKIKQCDTFIPNVNNEILTSTVSRKFLENKSLSTVETKQKKKRKREFNNVNSTREDASNVNELMFSKKRLRKSLKTEEDYDMYMDNLVVQMKHMASLDILEPNIGQNFSIYNMKGSNEKLKQVKTKDWLINNFDSEQITPQFENIFDFYGEQPFGFLKSTLKNNVLHMQNDFYDQEFLNYSFTNEQKKIHKLLNSMKCRNFDLSENILTKKYRSISGVIQCESYPHSSFPGLVVINNADQKIGRLSPVIPFVKPISVNCDSFYSTGSSVTHSKKYINMDVFKSSSNMESCIRKHSTQQPNEEQSNLTVILTVSSVDVVGVLRDLASLLNIISIPSFRLLKDVNSADHSGHQKDFLTLTKNQSSYDIQGILNGSIKFCRNCGFLSSKKLSLRSPFKHYHNYEQNYNNLKALSGYMYFCRKACLTHFMRKNMSFSSKGSYLKKCNHKSTLQKHYKNLSGISKKNVIKKCRFKNFKFNCLVPRARATRNHKGIDGILFELDTTMSPCNISQTPRKYEDNLKDIIRHCFLCNKKGDAVWNGASRLLNIDVEKWVHLNCALWSNGVYETISGGLVNVESALDFGQNQSCSSCHQLGATIKCIKSRCDSFYHLLCAKNEQCVFYKNKFIHCQTHYSKFPKDNELKSLNAKRRVFIERDENQQVDIFMQIQDLRYLLRVGSVIYLNVGQLLPHQLKEFHTANYIYPVGYKAIRFYWSMKTPNKRCRYLCTITEVGNRPEFTVLVEDQNESSLELRDSSPNAVWKRILEPIVALKKQQNLLQVFPKFISGDDFFGLNEPSIIRILENLPGVETFNDYRFKFDRNPLSKVPLHVSGAARTEPQQRQVMAPKKPHTQRTATSVNQRLSNSMIVGEVACPYSKQFVHSKSSQYKKMNQEWRNNVYLARSKIQGLGLYAARDLEKHTMVIEYIGEVIRSEVSEIREKQYEAKNRGIYMFRLDEDRIVDATLSGGLARYINHSCYPNCVTEVVDVERELRIIIFAKRRINRGEELTYDYKFDIEDDANKLPCMCGAPNCRKRMN